MAALKTLLFIILISTVRDVCSKRSTIFPIGGIFSDSNLESQQEFERIATSKGLGSTNAYNGRVICSTVRDTYSTALDVCENTSGNDGKPHGVIAIIDARPTDGICDTICLLSNRLAIAHLSIGWEPTESMSEDIFTFSYYPSPSKISGAYATLIKELGWDRFSIFYEDDSSFVRLQQIIGTWSLSNLKDPITYRRLIPGGENRETFKHIIKTAHISHHIIDCEVENIRHYINEIIQVEDSTQYQSFIFTNLDAHGIDLGDIPEMKANISTMFITLSDPSGGAIKMETALTADALKHLGKAITEMQMNKQSSGEEVDSNDYESGPSYTEPPPLCFDSREPWEWGTKLREALLQVKANGTTGFIEFDEEGRRTNFQLYYAKMNHKGQFTFAGVWDSNTDKIKKEETVLDRAQTESGVIRVISRKGLPYFIINKDEEGNEYPRGYAVDLITEIFQKIKSNTGMEFELKFRYVKDGEYGNPIEGTKKWSGIMGELMEHEADLGICDLTITSERNSVVDFSTPFMTTGIRMLFRESEPVDPDMFSFINPLSIDVWLYLATTYIIVSFIFLICARMSNLDWVNPHPCNQNPENLENIWSFYNCTWFAMGTIMTQGCDILPRGLGSRWIAGLWWFFAMIVTASYTANMSTFLSNSRRSNEITNAQELAKQNTVRYGAVKAASTYKFFQKSNDTTYQKILQVMDSAKPSVFAKDNDEGKDRVLKSKGNYAFFMESAAIKYYTERESNLKVVGPPLDSKSYGIAMPKNSPHKSRIDGAIIELQEAGRLAELEEKWWKKEDNPSPRKVADEEEDDGSLQMKNTSGIFLVLGVGGILGLIVAVIDFLIHANKIAVKEKLTFKEAVISEWNASLNPRTMAKPVAPPRSVKSSSGSPSPHRERSTSRAVSVLRAASSFINFDEIY